MQYRVKQTQTDTLCPTQHRRKSRKWQRRIMTSVSSFSNFRCHILWPCLSKITKDVMKMWYRISNPQTGNALWPQTGTDVKRLLMKCHMHAWISKTLQRTHTHTNRPGFQHRRRQMLIWILHDMIKASSSASTQIHFLPRSNFAFKFLHPNDYRGIFYDITARKQHTELLLVLNESVGEHFSRSWGCALL